MIYKGDATYVASSGAYNSAETAWPALCKNPCMKRGSDILWKSREIAAFYHNADKNSPKLRDERHIRAFLNRLEDQVVVVDLGIGTGRELEWLEKVANVAKVIGVDYNKEMLKMCESVWHNCRKELTLVEEDMRELYDVQELVASLDQPAVFLCLANTFGNLNQRDRAKALRRIRECMRQEDVFLIYVYKRFENVPLALYKRVKTLFNKHPEFKNVYELKKWFEVLYYSRFYPFIGDIVVNLFDQQPVYYYDDENHDIIIGTKNKIVYISHRWTEEEIREEVEKAGLIVKDVVEGDSSYLVVCRKKKLKMSEYIDIKKYNAHEEEHPFYREMTEEMLKQLKGKNRVLEIGAGTGLFTKKLSGLVPQLTAVEIDEKSFDFLKKALADTPVRLVQDDGIAWSNTGFDAVVSCFSHHHIQYNESTRYWQNIWKNLEKGGIYVVGDEFIPEFKNRKEMLAALKKYHNHIIALIKKQGFSELAELEQRCLEYGILGEGDYKRHCKMFEKNAADAGFVVEKKVKLGPKEDVGGVYVYVLRKP